MKWAVKIPLGHGQEKPLQREEGRESLLHGSSHTEPCLLASRKKCAQGPGQKTNPTDWEAGRLVR